MDVGLLAADRQLCPPAYSFCLLVCFAAAEPWGPGALWRLNTSYQCCLPKAAPLRRALQKGDARLLSSRPFGR